MNASLTEKATKEETGEWHVTYSEDGMIHEETFTATPFLAIAERMFREKHPSATHWDIALHDCRTEGELEMKITQATPTLIVLPKCPKCGAEDAMEMRRHRFDEDGGLPDCNWDECVVCGYRTDPE